MPVSSNSRAPASRAPYAARASEPPVEIRRAPSWASSATVGPPWSARRTLTGASTASIRVENLTRIPQVRRVHHVGAGGAVGDSRSIVSSRSVAAVEMVLRPSGQHEPGLAGGGDSSGDALGRRPDVVDLAGGGVVVLDRAPGGAGGGEQVNGLDHAGDGVGVEPSAVDASGTSTASASSRTWRDNSSRVTAWSSVPMLQAKPALVVARARKPRE